MIIDVEHKYYYTEQVLKKRNRRNKIMKKEMAKKSLSIMVIIFVIGIMLILSSSLIGQSFGDKAIERNGGVMDTSQYHRIIDTNSSNFQTVGMVLSLVGGFGLLLSCFALYKEL